MSNKPYCSVFTLNRIILILPDGSSYIINSTTDNEFMYGLSSVNLFCKMYEGYLSHFMHRPEGLFFDHYNSSLSLPWHTVYVKSDDE